MTNRKESQVDGFKIIYFWFEPQAVQFLTYKDVKSSHCKPTSPCTDQIHLDGFIVP